MDVLESIICNNTVDSSRPVITPSTQNTGTVGQLFSLTCSFHITSSYHVPNYTEPPTFEWTHSITNETILLPATASVPPSNPTEAGASGTYTSTLQFSPLLESHTGNYTCKVGGNGLLNASAVLNATGAPNIKLNFI